MSVGTALTSAFSRTWAKMRSAYLLTSSSSRITCTYRLHSSIEAHKRKSRAATFDTLTTLYRKKNVCEWCKRIKSCSTKGKDRVRKKISHGGWNQTLTTMTENRILFFSSEALLRGTSVSRASSVSTRALVYKFP